MTRYCSVRAVPVNNIVPIRIQKNVTCCQTGYLPRCMQHLFTQEDWKDKNKKTLNLLPWNLLDSQQLYKSCFITLPQAYWVSNISFEYCNLMLNSFHLYTVTSFIHACLIVKNQNMIFPFSFLLCSNFSFFVLITTI